MVFNLGGGTSDIANFDIIVGGTTYTIRPGEASKSVDGVYKYVNAGGINWELYLLVACTLRPYGKKNVDLWLLGGGSSGGCGDSRGSPYSASPGAGGAGGKVYSVSNTSLLGDISVAIGAGGVSANSNGAGSVAGGNTVVGSHSSASGTSKGAAANGTAVFDNASLIGPSGSAGTLYGAGGGHGAYEYQYYDGHTYDNWVRGPAQAGATNGGGTGGSTYGGNGAAATVYGSAGGGGGAASNLSYRSDWGKGGNGYQGFVAIRNHRS